MAENISVGSVSVDVVPDARQFPKRLAAQVDPQAKALGEGIGKRLADQIAKGIRDGIGDGFKGSEPTSREKGKKSGQDFGGSFAKEAKSRIEAALRSLPEAKIGVATTEAEQKLKDLRAEMEALSKQEIGVDISDAEALAKIDDLKFRLDRLAEESPSVQVRVDAAAAIAQLSAVQTMVNRVDGRTAKLKVEADTSQAERSLQRLRNSGGGGMGGMGLLGSLALTLGPAAIPLAGVGGAAAAALAGPAAAAGGGLAIGSIVAKAAVKRTQQQLKQIAELKKKMEAAQAAAANVGASSSSGNSLASAQTSAANQRASAQRSTQLQMASAQAALGRAKTPAARASAEQRISTIQASAANREATISSSLAARQATIHAAAANRQAAAQRKVAEATAAYKAALAGLSPAQKRYKDAQDSLKMSFDRLIKTAGPTILGPITKGMGLLAKVLPELKPLLTGVSSAIGTLFDSVAKVAKSSEFKGFIASFGDMARKSIVSFGRDFGNFATGFAGVLKAFAPLSDGVMKGLSGMSREFANFGTHLSESKAFQGFLQYVRDNGSKVGDVLSSAVTVVGKVIAGLAPLGSLVLGGLDGVLRFLRNAKPGTISAIGVAIGGLALAFGKGPLGLAFALAATMSHSKGFVSFLKTAGGYASDMAKAFDGLPTWAKEAAAAAVGVGIIGKKLTGSFTFGLGGKVAGGLLSGITKKSPMPVWVMNPGFTAPGGSPIPTGAPSEEGSPGIVSKAIGVIKWLGLPGALAAGTAVGMKKYGYAADPVAGSKGLQGRLPPIIGPVVTWLRSKLDPSINTSGKKIDALNQKIITFKRALDDLPGHIDLHVRTPELSRDLLLVQRYKGMLDGLDGRVVNTFIKSRLDHNAGQLGRFGHGIPRGATGGIVNRPTVALIGEAGPEAVVPLNRTAGNGPLPKGGGLGHGVNIEQMNLHGMDPHQWVRHLNHTERTAAVGGHDFRV